MKEMENNIDNRIQTKIPLTKVYHFKEEFLSFKTKSEKFIILKRKNNINKYKLNIENRSNTKNNIIFGNNTKSAYFALIFKLLLMI